MANDLTTMPRTQQLIDRGLLEIGDGYRAKSVELSDQGLPFARAGNIDGGFDFTTADYVAPERVPLVGSKVSMVGDVVLTSKGTVGRVAIVDEYTPRFVYSPQLCYWRSKNSDVIWPRYLFYWMRSPLFTRQINRVKGQTDMADYVSLADQRAMYLPLPPLAEQHAIANILGALDDKIDLNRRMNQTLEAVAQALFKSWFVDFDPFPSCSADELRSDKVVEERLISRSRGDQLPDTRQLLARWTHTPLSDVAVFQRSTISPNRFPTETFDHYSLPAFDNGRLPNPEVGAQIQSGKFLVAKEAVLLSKLNPRIPRVWLPAISSEWRSVCSTEFLPVLPRAGFSREYLYCLFNSTDFQESLAALVTGTTGSHQRVKPEHVLAMQVLAPSQDLVDQFAAAVGPLLGRVSNNLRDNTVLASLRDALLPTLLSGEIRVQEAEEAVVEAL